MNAFVFLAKKICHMLLKPLKDSKIDVYTDGSYKDGHGAWAFVVVRNGKVMWESSGYCKHTSSDRMEFQAAIEALQYLPESSRIRIHTDSRTMIENMNKRIHEWKHLEWKTKKKIPNIDLLQSIDLLSDRSNVSWHWVKAHSGIIYNERCDELCREARIKKMSFSY